MIVQLTRLGDRCKVRGLASTVTGLADFGPGQGTVFDETATAEDDLTIVGYDAHDARPAEQAP